MTEIHLDEIVTLLNRLAPHLQQQVPPAHGSAAKLTDVAAELEEHRVFWSLVFNPAEPAKVAFPIDGAKEIRTLTQASTALSGVDTATIFHLAHRSCELSFAVMSALPGDPTIYPPGPRPRRRLV